MNQRDVRTHGQTGGRRARGGQLIHALENRTLLAATNWGWAPKMIALDQAVAKYPGLTGAGYTVAVIDSGVDYKHPVLGGGFGGKNKVQGGWDFTDNDADPFTTTDAHGTGTAGVIAADGYTFNGAYQQGVAPGAKIVALRAGNVAQTQAALDWVLANRATYNIGAVEFLHVARSEGQYKSTIDALAAAGVFVAHPSGNAGPATPAKDGASSFDFSVGSVNSSGAVSSFTQRGAALDLLAPGENVTVPYYNPKTGEHYFTDAADGTSWAAPAVTGTAILIKQVSAKFTPAQIMQIMQDSGTATFDPTSGLTYKRLNVAGAVALAYQRAGTPPPPVVTKPTPPVATPAPKPTTPARPTPPVVAKPTTPTTPVKPAPKPIPPPPPPVQGPFTGTATRVAGTTIIQAEDFDKGGQGLAYHETDARNTGGSAYRADGVDVQLAGTLRSLTATRAGEWVEYTVNVTAAGAYTLVAKVASLGAGGRFHIEVDGQNKTGSLVVPDTKGASRFTAVSGSAVALSAGVHVIRLSMDSVGAGSQTGAFDALVLTQKSATSTGGAAPAPGAKPGVVTNPLAPAAQNGFAVIKGSGFSQHLGATQSGTTLGSLGGGDWVAFKGLSFGKVGATKLAINLAAAGTAQTGTITVRVGGPTGPIVGTVSVTGTGGAYKTKIIATAPVRGTQDVYLTFSGGASVASLGWMQFQRAGTAVAAV